LKITDEKRTIRIR